MTVIRDEPAPPAGRGIARTGVTAIVPGARASVFRRPVPSGVAALNGAGELTGFHTTGREGRLVRALPHEPVLALLREHGRI